MVFTPLRETRWPTLFGLSFSGGDKCGLPSQPPFSFSNSRFLKFCSSCPLKFQGFTSISLFPVRKRQEISVASKDTDHDIHYIKHLCGTYFLAFIMTISTLNGMGT